MRILTWNVNGIRAIQKKGFIDWLIEDSPDILCIQETKANDNQLSDEFLHPDGYTSYWQSAQKGGYSGTATYTKSIPLIEKTLENEEFDREGRGQILEFPSYVVINAYFPNSQDERRRLPYKLRFFKHVTDLCNQYVNSGKSVILCGDYNVAHTAIDLANPDTNENSAGYYIEEREAMTTFLSQGYVDTFRHFDKTPEQYTYWSYRTRARDRNAGWRLDYITVDKNTIAKVQQTTIRSDVMGSDHCPVEMTINF